MRLPVPLRLAILGVLVSCAYGRGRLPRPAPRPAVPLTPPSRLCVTDVPRLPCREADEVERWLALPDLELLGAAEPPAGIQGPRVLTLRVPGPEPVVFRAKWRAHATASAHNSPRRELAAHALQRLLLSPRDYVVPPAAAHGFPLAPYRGVVDARAAATFAGIPCVYGVLSYWLEDVQTLPDAERAGWFDFADGGLLDHELYESNPRFRASIGALNLVTYLIAHGDTHWKQFLIARDRSRPVVYSVDNSISFGAAKNRHVRQDWSLVLVPALPRAAIQRLRVIGGHLDELSSFAELEPRNGRLEIVSDPRGSAPGPVGVRWGGGRLHVGLTVREIDGLRHRVVALLARVDRGELQVRSPR